MRDGRDLFHDDGFTRPAAHHHFPAAKWFCSLGRSFQQKSSRDENNANKLPTKRHFRQVVPLRVATDAIRWCFFFQKKSYCKNVQHKNIQSNLSLHCFPTNRWFRALFSDRKHLARQPPRQKIVKEPLLNELFLTEKISLSQNETNTGFEPCYVFVDQLRTRTQAVPVSIFSEWMINAFIFRTGSLRFIRTRSLCVRCRRMDVCSDFYIFTPKIRKMAAGLIPDDKLILPTWISSHCSVCFCFQTQKIEKRKQKTTCSNPPHACVTVPAALQRNKVTPEMSLVHCWRLHGESGFKLSTNWIYHPQI